MLDVPGMMGCINSCLSSGKAFGNSRVKETRVLLAMLVLVCFFSSY